MILENDPGGEERTQTRKPGHSGTRRPNLRGVFDLHGNVWEWCQDWFELNPKAEAKDPAGPAEEKSKAYRGGSYEQLLPSLPH